MKTIIEKFKKFLLSIWKELKDLKTLVLFFVVVLVIYSPVWGGYLIYAIFRFPWSLTMATVCLAFWAGPFTPFFPICIAVTLAIKRGVKRIRRIKQRKQGKK